MTFDEKIQKAREIIAQHNAKAEKKISADDFVKRLEAFGGTSDEALQQTSWEDLEKCGLPRLLAKQVAQIFRTRNGTERPKFISEARSQGMSVEELLEAYDPKDSTNTVGKRLGALSKGQPAIVFDATGKVNAKASAELIHEIGEGYPPREKFVLDGRPVPIFKVGERPNLFADQNPLYPGRILRLDQTCDQTNRSWDGVPQEVRVLLFLAVAQTKELVISRLDDAHAALDLAVSSDAAKTLRVRYTEASILYDRLQNEGGLPTLKRVLGQGGTQKNDPFFAEHRRW